MNLYLADKFPVENGDTLICVIERTNSDTRQGFSVDVTGYCEMNGQVFKQGKGIMLLLWEDTSPKEFRLKVFTKKGFVWIQNICEVDYSYLITNEFGAPVEVHKKRTDYGHNGAAMIVEKIENGRRYKCSDTSSAEKADPFGDIVFTVQRMKLP
jgi:hypothetical protein